MLSDALGSSESVENLLRLAAEVPPRLEEIATEAKAVEAQARDLGQAMQALADQARDEVAQAESALAELADFLSDRSDALSEGLESGEQSVQDALNVAHTSQRSVEDSESRQEEAATGLQAMFNEVQSLMQQIRGDLDASMDQLRGQVQTTSDLLENTISEARANTEQLRQEVETLQEAVATEVEHMAEVYAQVSDAVVQTVQDACENLDQEGEALRAFLETLAGDVVKGGVTGLMDRAQSAIESELKEAVTQIIRELMDQIEQMIRHITGLSSDTEQSRGPLEDLIHELMEMWEALERLI